MIDLTDCNMIHTRSFNFDQFQWGTADAEIKTPPPSPARSLVGAQGYQRFLLFKPGVGIQPYTYTCCAGVAKLICPRVHNNNNNNNTLVHFVLV